MTTLTRAQVRELDRRAIAEYGVPGVVLMENAGRGAAEVLMRLNPDRQPVLVCCGKGNNGGDGFVIARHLDIHGWPVWLAGFASPQELTGDAAVMERIATAAGIPAALAPAGCPADWLADQFAPGRAGWVVDALFGTGLTGPLREPYDRVVAAINAGAAKVLVVDIPSGLDCDTGKPLGPAVRADHTVTFVAPKAGFAAPEAREWLGEVHVVGIGAPRTLLEQYGIQPPHHPTT
jgi:NAD(P)H-hydrate epimerase